ncbi:hypothetical protein SAMN04488490_1848 [Marinobacter sp. LV10R510-11A]|uniref:hypothetical protein n=1 Tax=Marinobacter sp. LV10R510-11A TaxID=1415568 RepID=UPI000BB965D0|nr:hypothetical protein [Marinobacter sp. LV10R510-11A]SOB76170.1 hypothetical protein SAMN04488490_1848 [Marinobacter sp. LV10R510-11A]
MADDVNDRRGWHVDKGIGVAHIITTLMLIVTALWYIAGQDRRIAVLELGVNYLQQSRINDQSRTEKKFDELKTDLRTINSKLDRLIESDR